MMEEEEKNMLWGPLAGPPAPNAGQPPPMMMRRPDSSDDRHVIAKHGQIYPTDEQLACIQKQVILFFFPFFPVQLEAKRALRVRFASFKFSYKHSWYFTNITILRMIKSGLACNSFLARSCSQSKERLRVF